jgi:hypothetical protein
MSKMSENPAEPKESYTPEEVKEEIKKAQRAQLDADEMRVHGNAFFAEALDHISGIAAKDKFWAKTWQYGALFRKQFEANTGQVEIPSVERKEPDKK